MQERNTAGTFADSNTLFPGFPSGAYGIQNAALAWGDYDNDGDLDIALVGAIASNLYLRAAYTNNGGTFVSQFSVQGGSACKVLGWGDYDNDGYSDLIILGNLRHILVDTNGLLLRVLVHPADISESEGAEWSLGEHDHAFPRLETVRADQG